MREGILEPLLWEIRILLSFVEKNKPVYIHINGYAPVGVDLMISNWVDVCADHYICCF